jgi:hypothetical protein
MKATLSRPALGPSTLRDDLHREIAHALRTSGSYRGEIESPHSQPLIDAQWAAHLAGRTVGIRVQVTVCDKRTPTGGGRVVLHVTPRVR